MSRLIPRRRGSATAPGAPPLPPAPHPPRAYVERPVAVPLRWGLSVVVAAGAWAGHALEALRRRGTGADPPAVEPGGADVVIRGTVFPGDERTYLLVPFEVRPGVGRLEIDYDYGALPPALQDNPLTQTVVDLGLWDEHGYRDPAGFRGWSGSRHRSVFVQADQAQRAYRRGPVNPGIWHAELGLAAVGPTGGHWSLSVRGKPASAGQPPEPDPVDATHVANAAPGWYHGDFHMHSWHSNPAGPTLEEVVGFARAAGLDFLPVTEYVVGHHWLTAGSVQRAHPDLVIWPGREIVTYFGHVQSLGETPGFIEYRHGFEDIRMGGIQQAVRASGALFGVNHPTTFPGPLFRNLCRGCAFELDGEIDWDAVDTIEVLTGPALVRPEEFHLADALPDGAVEVANPFMDTAIDLWERLLNRGHRICAVSGSDDKRGPGLGSSATAVHARALSRPALIEAIRAGRAYVRTRGVAASPALEMEVSGPGGHSGTFGSTVVVGDAPARFTVTVRGGSGQALRVIRNGDELFIRAVTGDPFTTTFEAHREAGEGPLGTWYRVETFDARGRTTIGNPAFLTAS